jgi:hypothetical protein
MTMRIWRLYGGYFNNTYAQAAAVGTWVRQDAVCPECGVSLRERVQPLVIEWEKGSDEVADFTSAGLGGVMVTDRVVAGLLQAGFRGFEAGPVEMVQDPKLSRRQKVVRLPYDGPPIFDLWVTSWVHADMERSSVTLRAECVACNIRRWELHDVEHVQVRYDQVRKELIQTRTPRVSGKGVLIPQNTVQAIDIFRIHEFPGYICCTDRLRDFVLNQGYSNAEFREIGETFLK